MKRLARFFSLGILLAALIAPIVVLTFASHAQADETPSAITGPITGIDAGAAAATTEAAGAQQPIRRDIQSSREARQFDVSSDDESESRPRGAGHSGVGFLFQGYYDPVSIYNKMLTSPVLTSFSSQNGTGMGGIQALILFSTRSHFEFSAGLDYIFPVNVQSQQPFYGTYTVNSQTLNIMGLKVFQVGYQYSIGNFSITPYAGLGVYYGKDVVNLSTGFSQIDTLTYTKLVATIAAGVRGEFDLDRDRNFALGAAAEVFQPMNLATQFSQSGTITSELPGYEPYLQQGMDFMTSTGFRILADIKATF